MPIEVAYQTQQATSNIEADLLSVNNADGNLGLYVATADLASFISDNETLFHLIATRSTPAPANALRVAASAPTAAFTPTNGSPANVAVGEEVQFTDATTDGVLQWYWDFGDGSTSREQNPTHAYSEAGSYTVTLRAVNKTGQDTATEADAVVVT